MEGIRSKVIHYLDRWGVENGNHVLVGCSGGPDSTALLHILHTLQNERGIDLSCVYIDHGLRPLHEIREDIAFLETLTGRFQLSLYTTGAPERKLHLIAEREGRSLEEVARAWRYKNLFLIAEQISAQYIALGHTLDDHIETVLMRFFQGASYGGLGGIPAKNGKILRPLLACGRQEILDYLDTSSLSFRIDSTNIQRNILRNRIRIDLVPAIIEVFPGFKKSLRALSEKMNILKNFLDLETTHRITWSKVRREGLISYRVLASDFIKAAGAIRLHSLYHTINLLHRERKSHEISRIPFRFLSGVLEDRWFFPKRTLLRGHRIRLLWRGEYLFLEQNIVYPNKKGYLIVVKKEMRCTVDRTDLILTSGVLQDSGTDDDLFTVAESAVKYPLIVRSRRPGDRINLARGRKSLKKLFNEWKIPEYRRSVVPIIADRGGILCVLAKGLGYKNRFAAGQDNKQARNGQEAMKLMIRIERTGN